MVRGSCCGSQWRENGWSAQKDASSFSQIEFLSSTCVGIYSTYCFYVTALFSLLITSSANSLSLWQQSSTSSIIRTWNVLNHEMQELKKYLTNFVIMSGHLCKVIYRILRDCRCHSLQYNGIPDWTSTDKWELDGGSEPPTLHWIELVVILLKMYTNFNWELVSLLRSLFLFHYCQ